MTFVGKKPGLRRGFWAAIAIMMVAVPCSSLNPSEIEEIRSIISIQNDAERLKSFDTWAKRMIPSDYPADTVGNWEYIESIDEMDGTVSGRYVISYSENELSGWLNTGPLLFGVSCTDSVYIRANDLGFDYDYRDRSQNTRIRFDDEAIYDVNWIVWEDNRDGASLSNSNDSLLSKMLGSKRLMIEVVLSNVDGRRQVANFNLLGFSDIYERCRS